MEKRIEDRQLGRQEGGRREGSSAGRVGRREVVVRRGELGRGICKGLVVVARHAAVLGAAAAI